MSNGSGSKLFPFPSSYRASGLLLHVTSLPSPYGIGDVGPVAIAWVDQLCDAGQCWWQALPLGPTGYGNSPYQSLSSFAVNVLLISPDWLIEDGSLSATDCEAPSFSAFLVDYNAVIPFKYRLLEKAWTNFVSEVRGYELPLNSSATSRRTGWKITRSFERSNSGTMALTISSGRRSWYSVCRKLWPRPGVIWRTKWIKFVLLNSYCFAKGHGLRNMPELKVCA